VSPYSQRTKNQSKPYVTTQPKTQTSLLNKSLLQKGSQHTSMQQSLNSCILMLNVLMTLPPNPTQSHVDRLLE
jgi:hypothetical protein